MDVPGLSINRRRRGFRWKNWNSARDVRGPFRLPPTVGWSEYPSLMV